MMREAIVDANILLRYLTDEPRTQADHAALLLETAETAGMSLIVAPLTLAEVVYVLESVYEWDRQAVANGLLHFATASALLFLEADVVDRALGWYRDFPGLDFANAYVASLAVKRDHGRVISFDRDLHRLPEITVFVDPEQLQDGQG